MDETFLIKLSQELIRNLPHWYGSDNWDSEVLPYRESIKDRIFTYKRIINRTIFNDYSLVRTTDINQLLEILALLEHSVEGLPAFYRLLNDDYSRSLLIMLLAHRKMGYRKVKLPLNVPEYWAMRKFASTLVKSQNKINIEFRDFVLQHMELSTIGFPLEIFFLPGGVTITFILKQYEYQRSLPAIKAQPGDFVIDAGGCWGDTSLYFAHTVGAHGKVYTFEFESDNLLVLHRNLALNPELSKRIEVIPSALWDKSGEEISYSLNGPATSLFNNKEKQGSLRASTLTIDEFVKGKGLPRVDFIKMDIEGSELKALQGAQQTMYKFKPQLAISIYHKDEDFIEIPRYLDNLNLGYEFYMDHFTIYRGETILFARTRPG